MTVHRFDPVVSGFEQCLPDGKIREKFVAVGETIGIGQFRNHPDLVRAMLQGPLTNLPKDLRAALAYVIDHEIPVAFGNILTDQTIELLTGAEHDLNACRLHHESILATLAPTCNRAL